MWCWKGQLWQSWFICNLHLHLHRRDIPFQFTLNNSVSTSDRQLCCVVKGGGTVARVPAHSLLLAALSFVFGIIYSFAHWRNAVLRDMRILLIWVSGGRTMLAKFYIPNIPLSAINAILNNTWWNERGASDFRAVTVHAIGRSLGLAGQAYSEMNR